MPNSDLPAWLIEQITRKPSLEVLFNGFCKKLAKQGLPIWRVNIGLETLHPADVGFSFVWLDGELSHAIRKSPRFAGQSEQVSGPHPIADDEAAVAHAALEPYGALLYARVDLARDAAGQPRVMELELVENCGHFIADERPDLVAERAAEFFGGTATA